MVNMKQSVWYSRNPSDQNWFASIFTVRKDRNVGKIGRGKCVVISKDNTRWKLSINEKGVLIKITLKKTVSFVKYFEGKYNFN